MHELRLESLQGVDEYLNEDHDTDTVEACEEEDLGEERENSHNSQVYRT
jgi:hypothetical protein